MSTEIPKKELAAPSAAVIFACCVQVVPERVKMYAEPWLAFVPMPSAHAPTTTVSPSIATSIPNISPAAPSLAISFASCIHIPFSFLKMYAAPWSVLPPISALGAPMTALLPRIEMLPPKLSPDAPSLVISLAACGKEVNRMPSSSLS